MELLELDRFAGFEETKALAELRLLERLPERVRALGVVRPALEVERHGLRRPEDPNGLNFRAMDVRPPSGGRPNPIAEIAAGLGTDLAT
jgi:hypothetical protein